MKIKASSNKANVSALVFVFAVMTVVAAVLRTFQVFRLIDASTGFYKEKSFITALLYAVVIGSCLVFCLVSYLSRNSTGIVTHEIDSKRLSVFTVVFAFAMLLDCLKSFLLSVGNSGDTNVYEQESKLRQLMGSGSIFQLVQSLFALLSFIYLLYLAYAIKSGSTKASEHKLLALAPAGWSAFRLVGLFVSKISFMQVSDLFLELVMLSFMTLFFMAVAQTTSGVYSDLSGWRIPAFGFSSALIAGTLSISRLIATCVNRQMYINPSHTFNITDLFFFIFAVMYVYEVTREYNLVFERE